MINKKVKMQAGILEIKEKAHSMDNLMTETRYLVDFYLDNSGTEILNRWKFDKNSEKYNRKFQIVEEKT